MIRLAPLLVLTATLVAAPAFAETPWPPAMAALLDYHASACATQGGKLAIAPDAVSDVYFFGPEEPAQVLDSRKLTCPTAPAMFCADTVGCELTVFVGPAMHSLVVLDWSVATDDDRQVLHVTISGELLNKPQATDYRMTWDAAT